jgi:protease-4
MSYFVFQELLENKLGIQPVFLTKGDKKDWPSSFRAPKQEEMDYLEERLLTPAYERFVGIVQEGRAGILSAADVRRLADGSIYGAPKALEEKLIDEVGYLDDAIAMAKSLAGLAAAQVIEYRRPFSFMDMLSVKSANTLKLSRTTLYELSTPEVLYMWSAY